MRRTDCIFVAGDAATALQPQMQDRGLGIISTRRYDGKEIPLFKELGFGHHAINYAEGDDGTFFAFDLTAHYNLDAEQGRYDAFGVMALSLKDLKAYLKDLSGSSWDES